MMISLLLALYCPRLLVAIAKVAITVATHLLLAVLLWLPSCAAGTVSGDAPFAEEPPPPSPSQPPPSPSNTQVPDALQLHPYPRLAPSSPISHPAHIWQVDPHQLLQG